MSASNRYLPQVFGTYFSPTQLSHLETTAKAAIERKLGAARLSDRYHRDEILALVTERIERRFQRVGADDIQDFPSYFLTSVEHEVTRYVRRERQHKMVEAEALESLRELQRSVEAEIQLPFDSLIDEDLADDVTSRAFSRLKQREQELITASLRSGQSEAKRAEERGLTVAGLRSAQWRAMQRLKEAVSEEIEREILSLSERPPTAPTPKRGGAE